LLWAIGTLTGHRIARGILAVVPSGSLWDTVWLIHVLVRTNLLGCFVERWFFTSDLLLELISSPVVVKREERMVLTKYPAGLISTHAEPASYLACASMA
jgi:hypothetical protein